MLSFGNSPGTLFGRLGKCGLTVKQLRSYIAAQLTNLTDVVNGVVAQYNSESDLQAIVGDGYQGVLAAANGGLGGIVQPLAQSTFDRMVFRDNPQPGQTLNQPQVLPSIFEVIRQMKLEGATVLAMTVTATPGAFVGTGNGAAVAGTVRPLDGKTLENSFTENLTLVCSADSYTGGATVNNEGFALTGAGAQTNLLAFNWPLGSGANTGLNAVDANTNNGSGNLLFNGGFTAFTVTANVPDGWTLTVGTAGVNTFQESSILFGGTGALRIQGDGAGTLTALTQTFNGPANALSPLSQYSCLLWLRRDGVAAGAGQLVVELVDGNGNPIKDAGGNNTNTMTVDLTALTTVYTPYGFAFRTPLVLPAVQQLRLRLGTALTNGRSVYLDGLGVGVMTQAYVSGPWAAVHAGAVPFAQGDYALIAVNNSRGAGGTYSTWQTLLCQLLDPLVLSNEILFPSSASSPTVPDSWIN